MKKIKILDCTLRDGGYVNNWNFGKENIKSIIKELADANVDYIECGFLKDMQYNLESSLFSIPNDILNITKPSKHKFMLMINYGEYPIGKIPSNSNIIFRIAFKKNDFDKALEYCKEVKNKNNDICINPMYTNTYSTSELLNLINIANEIKPLIFTIVDSSGGMQEEELLTTYYLINDNLDKDIAIGFHSHNNLKLSFSNAQKLIKICNKRELVIDSTAFGIGRAAGNLCTEVITKYLNDNYNSKYNLLPILKIVEEQINPIFKITPWGYSVPYYLAALNFCHPSYAKYLNDKKISVNTIDRILKQIPNNKKNWFDENFIKALID